MYVLKNNKEETIDDLMIRLKRELKQEKEENRFKHAEATKDNKKLLKMDVKRLKRDRDVLIDHLEQLLGSIDMVQIKAKDENGVKIPMDYRQFLITSACAMFGTCESSINKKNRLRNNVYARQYIWSDIRKRNPNITLENLGRIFEGSVYDHSTVKYNILKHEEQKDVDTIYRIKCDQLDSLIDKFLTQ